MAQSRGASYFDIGDTWDNLTPAARTAANNRFLDGVVARGDVVTLATPRAAIRYPSSLADEVGYLTEHGYKWADDATLVVG